MCLSGYGRSMSHFAWYGQNMYVNCQTTAGTACTIDVFVHGVRFELISPQLRARDSHWPFFKGLMKRKVFFATPTYDYNFCAEYTASMMMTCIHLGTHKIEAIAQFVGGMCFIDLARNKLTQAFLKPPMPRTYSLSMPMWVGTTLRLNAFWNMMRKSLRAWCLSANSPPSITTMR